MFGHSNNTTHRPLGRILSAPLVLFGVWAAGSLAWQHLRHGEACPVLAGVLPACYLAFSGYFLMLLGLTSGKHLARRAFLSGWLIATLLAAVASVAEWMHGNVCPASESGIPLCYFSLGMALTSGALFWLPDWRRAPG